ncbi:hypothetical protein FOL46_003962 [Perkinsus olseni]|uniref:Uncharacterized protein n=1 Tax=Perkinsus olseni TaxID=32597 RepID=A0A7J6M068_PEROL|nr:hypothetical protein FOL46_003962 [Perkinsus olseni]
MGLTFSRLGLLLAAAATQPNQHQDTDHDFWVPPLPGHYKNDNPRVGELPSVSLDISLNEADKRQDFNIKLGKHSQRGYLVPIASTARILLQKTDLTEDFNCSFKKCARLHFIEPTVGLTKAYVTYSIPKGDRRVHPPGIYLCPVKDQGWTLYFGPTRQGYLRQISSLRFPVALEFVPGSKVASRASEVAAMLEVLGDLWIPPRLGEYTSVRYPTGVGQLPSAMVKISYDEANRRQVFEVDLGGYSERGYLSPTTTRRFVSLKKIDGTEEARFPLERCARFIFAEKYNAAREAYRAYGLPGKLTGYPTTAMHLCRVDDQGWTIYLGAKRENSHVVRLFAPVVLKSPPIPGPVASRRESERAAENSPPGSSPEPAPADPTLEASDEGNNATTISYGESEEIPSVETLGKTPPDSAKRTISGGSAFEGGDEVSRPNIGPKRVVTVKTLEEILPRYNQEAASSMDAAPVIAEENRLVFPANHDGFEETTTVNTLGETPVESSLGAAQTAALDGAGPSINHQVLSPPSTGYYMGAFGIEEQEEKGTVEVRTEWYSMVCPPAQANSRAKSSGVRVVGMLEMKELRGTLRSSRTRKMKDLLALRNRTRNFDVNADDFDEKELASLYADEEEFEGVIEGLTRLIDRASAWLLES